MCLKTYHGIVFIIISLIKASLFSNLGFSPCPLLNAFEGLFFIARTIESEE